MIRARALPLLLLLLVLPTPLIANDEGALPLASQGPADLDHRWLGPDGERLPFTTHEDALEFLHAAEVVASKRLDSGITRPHKLTLERDGVRAHAIFRTVERDLDRKQHDRPSFFRERDSYVFEVAAYKVSRLLGLERVPPVVLREIDGEHGSLQLWVENARTEAKLIQSGEADHGAAARLLQKQQMMIFDQLIYNFDRHQGNALYDSYDYLWYIDHTRSFKPLPQLQAADKIAVIDGGLLAALRRLDSATLRHELRPYLDVMQIDSLEKRRRMILARIDGLIAERGEDGVIVDVEGTPPPPVLAGSPASSSDPGS